MRPASCCSSFSPAGVRSLPTRPRATWGRTSRHLFHRWRSCGPGLRARRCFRRWSSRRWRRSRRSGSRTRMRCWWRWTTSLLGCPLRSSAAGALKHDGNRCLARAARRRRARVSGARVMLLVTLAVGIVAVEEYLRHERAKQAKTTGGASGAAAQAGALFADAAQAGAARGAGAQRRSLRRPRHPRRRRCRRRNRNRRLRRR